LTVATVILFGYTFYKMEKFKYQQWLNYNSNTSSPMYIQESTHTVKFSWNWSNSTNKKTLYTYPQSLLQTFI